MSLSMQTWKREMEKKRINYSSSLSAMVLKIISLNMSLGCEGSSKIHFNPHTPYRILMKISTLLSQMSHYYAVSTNSYKPLHDKYEIIIWVSCNSRYEVRQFSPTSKENLFKHKHFFIFLQSYLNFIFDSKCFASQ